MDLENKQQHNLGLLYFWFFGFFLVFWFLVFRLLVRFLLAALNNALLY